MKKTAFLGLYVAFAMILSYIEALIPLPLPIPGVKIGLANLAIILVMYLFGSKEAFIVNLLRIFLTGFLFTNMSMILYSLAGGMLSLLFMSLAKRSGLFGIRCVSLIGGVMHNIGQLLVAYCTIHTYGIFYYVPFLMLSGAITGYLIGILEHLIEPRLRYFLKNNQN